jgi:hypothetical protein
MKHTFIVEVHCEEEIDARLVMSERLAYDEDYGFPYEIYWEWK